MSLSQAQIDQYNLDTNVTVDAAGDGYQPYEECAIVGLWKPSDGTPDDDPACHKIGIPHPVGTQVYTRTAKYNQLGSAVEIEFPKLSEVVEAGIVIARPVTVSTLNFYVSSTEHSALHKRLNGSTLSYSIPQSSAPTIVKAAAPIDYRGRSMHIGGTGSGASTVPVVIYAIVKPWDGVIRYPIVQHTETDTQFSVIPRVCATLKNISVLIEQLGSSGTSFEINITKPNLIGSVTTEVTKGCVSLHDGSNVFDVNDEFKATCSLVNTNYTILLKFE